MPLIDTGGVWGIIAAFWSRPHDHCTFGASSSRDWAYPPFFPLLRPACSSGPRGTLYNYLSCPRLPDTLSRRFSLSLPQAEATGDTSSGPRPHVEVRKLPSQRSLRAARGRGWAGGWDGGGEGFGVGGESGGTRIRARRGQPAVACIPAPSSTPGLPRTPIPVTPSPPPPPQSVAGELALTPVLLLTLAPPVCFLFRNLRRP